MLEQGRDEQLLVLVQVCRANSNIHLSFVILCKTSTRAPGALERSPGYLSNQVAKDGRDEGTSGAISNRQVSRGMQTKEMANGRVQLGFVLPSAIVGDM
jgi:hypothetical protein